MNEDMVNRGINVLYEMYKINWMKRISTKRQLEAYKDYFDGLVDCDRIYSFDDYIEEFGYNGELYVSFDEFLNNELLNKNYIYDLIDDNIKLRVCI